MKPPLLLFLLLLAVVAGARQVAYRLTAHSRNLTLPLMAETSFNEVTVEFLSLRLHLRLSDSLKHFPLRLSATNFLTQPCVYTTPRHLDEVVADLCGEVKIRVQLEKGHIFATLSDDSSLLQITFWEDKGQSRLQLPASLHLPPRRRMKRATRFENLPVDATADSLYIELYVVADRQFVSDRKSRGEDPSLAIFGLVSQAAEFLRDLKFQVVVVGVELWEKEDRYVESVGSTASSRDRDTLLDISRFRQEMVKSGNDCVFLLTSSRRNYNSSGKAKAGEMCSRTQSAGFVVVEEKEQGPFLREAATLAHEMGHLLGLRHDTSEPQDNCLCLTEDCFMLDRQGRHLPRRWSNCSVQTASNFRTSGAYHCLVTPATPGWPVAELGQCGDGHVTGEEECDAGPAGSVCCTPSCQLTPGSTCAQGGCCDSVTCQLLPRTAICRETSGSCDLPEFCDGESPWCPENVFIRNGVRCGADKSLFCYKGDCPSRDSQCRSLWGPTASDAAPVCYFFNLAAKMDHYKVFGCSYKFRRDGRRSFSACELADRQCGRLFCSHKTERPIFYQKPQYGSEFHQTGENSAECSYYNPDVSPGTRDFGYVDEGAACGADSLCVAGKCAAVTALSQPPCDECHQHGQCDTRGSCYCEDGWAPPHCNTTGHGGSLNSGPPARLSQLESTVSMALMWLLLTTAFGLLLIVLWFCRERLHFCGEQHLCRSLCRTISCKKCRKFSIKPPSLESPMKHLERFRSRTKQQRDHNLQLEKSRSRDIGDPIYVSSTNDSLEDPRYVSTNSRGMTPQQNYMETVSTYSDSSQRHLTPPPVPAKPWRLPKLPSDSPSGSTSGSPAGTPQLGRQAAVGNNKNNQSVEPSLTARLQRDNNNNKSSAKATPVKVSSKIAQLQSRLAL